MSLKRGQKHATYKCRSVAKGTLKKLTPYLAILC